MNLVALYTIPVVNWVASIPIVYEYDGNNKHNYQ